MGATIRDVAALSGLSIGTVSKYINGAIVKEDTKTAIDAAIEALNYHPNNIAKGLRNARSFSVGMLLPRLDSTFCTSMISSIESKLLPKGYSLIVCECHDDAKKELQKTQFLIDHMVDGIILIPYALDGKQIEMIQKHDIPLIVLDQIIDGHPADCILLDNEAAGYELTKQFTRLGHEEIAIITGHPKHYTTRGRLNGYKKALEEADIPVNHEYICDGAYTIDGGYRAVTDLYSLKKRPTAIFISNYDMTIGAYLAINNLNLKIPEDISVAGFDNFPLTNVVKPALTFAGQPTESMGADAGDLLYKRIMGDYSNFPEIRVHKPTIYKKDSIISLL